MKFVENNKYSFWVTATEQSITVEVAVRVSIKEE